MGRGTGEGAPDPGGVCRRRRGEGGQGDRGDHGASVEGFGWDGGGLRRRLNGSRRPAASCVDGGGAPAVGGRRGVGEKPHGSKVKLLGWLGGAEQY